MDSLPCSRLSTFRTIIRGKYLSAVLLVAFVAGSGMLEAQNVLVEFNGIDQRRIKARAFTTDADQTMVIEATGAPIQKSFMKKIGEAIIKRDYSVTLSAWILNSDTRELVWELENGTVKVLEDENTVVLRDEIALGAGKFEVYVYPRYFTKNVSVMGIFDYDSHEDVADFADEVSDFFRDIKIELRGNGTLLSPDVVNTIHKSLIANAIVAIEGDQPNQLERRGFTLAEDMELRVYSIGELYHKDEFDYGWIQNAETGVKVWDMSHQNSRHAGGAAKNRMVDDIISLPKGSYVAHFASDDSHYKRSWNATPPHDPLFWGLAVFAANPAQRSLASTFNYKDMWSQNVIVDLSRLRDDSFEEKGFTLKKPMQVRIFALGEGLWGHLADYGWLVNSRTGERVWEMKYSRTEHAGGNDKNRMVQKTIDLPAGSYMAYFVTDDSHAYDDWNAAQPFEPERWGLTIIGGENYDAGAVKDYNPEEDRSVLAQLIRVTDDGHFEKRFTLDQAREVHIYALGEGFNGDMYDYAWIEEVGSGTVVWEMTYRMTRHAGGARKNRSYSGSIMLKAGQYEVFYKSDDSHSFSDWNDAPPFDPAHWGITVSQLK